MGVAFSKRFITIIALCALGLMIALGVYYRKVILVPRVSQRSERIADQKFLIESDYGFHFLSLAPSTPSKKDLSLLGVLNEILPSQGALLHLGAGEGLHTLLVARLSSKERPIIALEGNPKKIRLLKSNLSLHDIHNVQVIPCIASSQESSLSLCFDAEHTPSSDVAISKDYEQSLKGQDCHVIALTPIDHLSLAPVRFILVENEVNLGDMIMGAHHFLERSRYPDILVAEEDSITAHKDKKWIGFLRKKGYTFYRVALQRKHILRITRLDPYADFVKESLPRRSYILLSTKLLPKQFVLKQ